MALTNAEKQRAWRERHIIKRRDAQRVANLLMRVRVTDKQNMRGSSKIRTTVACLLPSVRALRRYGSLR